MMGKQHRIGTIGTSILTATILYKYCGYTPDVYLTVPVAYYFCTSPDADQMISCPHEWKTIKQVIIIAIYAVALLAIIGLGYGFYQWCPHHSPKYFALMSKSGIILLSYLAIFAYSKTKDGVFLFQHRGFTHTLVIPILLLLCYRQVIGLSVDGNLVYLIHFLSLGILGILIGYVSHIFEDLLCKAGCPILWPISPSMIHIGTAITSGKERGEAHLSSVLYTYALVAICLTLTVFIFMGGDIKIWH